MGIHTAYLITLEAQREQREHFHWQRLVNQAKRENRLTAPGKRKRRKFFGLEPSSELRVAAKFLDLM
jgi:hypothetical protein